MKITGWDIGGAHIKAAKIDFLKKNSTTEQAQIAEEISKNNGGKSFKWAQKTEERNKLWKARHDAYYAALAISPNKRAILG